MDALCVGLNEQKVSCSTLPRSVANSCYYYLGRKSKLSFHNEIPPSSLARDAPLISFSPKHVLRPLRGWWRWRRWKRERAEDGGGGEMDRNGEEEGSSPPPSLPLSPPTGPRSKREGGRPRPSVRPILRSLPQYPRQSLHSFSRSVCMIRATCRRRRPSRSLTGG